MTKYYQKEIPETPVYVHGHPLKFDVLETADPVLIGELDKCIAKQIGGVLSISKEVYDEEVKKKKTGSESGFSFNSRHTRQELSGLHARRVAEAAGKGGTFQFGDQSAFVQKQKDERPSSPVSNRPMPDPLEVPSPNQFSGIFLKPPPTAKASGV